MEQLGFLLGFIFGATGSLGGIVLLIQTPFGDRHPLAAIVIGIVIGGTCGTAVSFLVMASVMALWGV